MRGFPGPVPASRKLRFEAPTAPLRIVLRVVCPTCNAHGADQSQEDTVATSEGLQNITGMRLRQTGITGKFRVWRV